MKIKSQPIVGSCKLFHIKDAMCLSQSMLLMKFVCLRMRAKKYSLMVLTLSYLTASMQLLKMSLICGQSIYCQDVVFVYVFFCGILQVFGGGRVNYSFLGVSKTLFRGKKLILNNFVNFCYFLHQKSAKDDPVRKLSDYKNYLEFELKLLKDLENSKSNLAGKHVNHKNKTNDITDEVNIKCENIELKPQRLRLKCLFERAIADNSNCLDESLWLKYIFYLVKNLLSF